MTTSDFGLHGSRLDPALERVVKLPGLRATLRGVAAVLALAAVTTAATLAALAALPHSL